MAQTAGGTYYAASSELVSSWPATSLNLANQLETRFAAKWNSKVSDTAPSTPAEGDVWVDTTGSTTIPKVYTGSAWQSMGGKILQVVEGSYSTATAIASATYTDTNLSATITPSATSSKVLVMVTQFAYVTRGTSDIQGLIKLLRGATSLVDQGLLYIDAGNSGFSSIGTMGYGAITYLDSPSSTSAQTYKTQAKVSNAANGGTVTTSYNNARSSMILMEVAG